MAAVEWRCSAAGEEGNWKKENKVKESNHRK